MDNRTSKPRIQRQHKNNPKVNMRTSENLYAVRNNEYVLYARKDYDITDKTAKSKLENLLRCGIVITETERMQQENQKYTRRA